MQNFQDTFETPTRSFISVSSICMTIPLSSNRDVSFSNSTTFNSQKIYSPTRSPETISHIKKTTLLKLINNYVICKLLKKQSPGRFLQNFTKFTEQNLCWGVFFTKETPTQGFSCKYCEIFKNTFFNPLAPDLY